MENQFLLDALIELSPELLVENDNIPGDGTVIFTPTHQPIVSNQTMIDLGKKLLQAASENDIENVKALMTGGAPFSGNWLGTTPLHAAAKAGHIDTVELLLKAGIFRDAKTKVDRTALQMAAEEGHTEIVKLLIEYSADINAKDMLRMTALHWAVERGHQDTVSVLLEHGADVMTLNKFEKSPIDIAYENGFPDIIKLLESAADKASKKERLVETQIAAEKLMKELGTSEKSNNWRHISEEEALDKLAAATAGASPTMEATKLLESHGITLLPIDNSTVLNSVLESGQTLSLTEAGKMALNQTKEPVTHSKHIVDSPSKKLKLTQNCVGGPNVNQTKQNFRRLTMTAEQFLALAGAGKLRSGKGNNPMVITLPKKITAPRIENKTPTNSNIAVSAAFVIGNPTISATYKKPIEVCQTDNHVRDTTARSIQAISSNSTEALVFSDGKKFIAKVNNPIVSGKSIQLPSDGASGTVPKIVPGSVRTIRSADCTKTSIKPRSITSLVNAEKGSDTPSKIDQTNREGIDNREHFLKSGLLKGSARTTPIALLCKRGSTKTTNTTATEIPAVKSDTNQEHNAVDSKGIASNMTTSNSSVTLNNVFSLGEDMFIDNSEEASNGNAVWLSIMEEENSQFVPDNDEDLLDPSRLAAQLASIREAASQFTFSIN